ncbi:hypothetical protein [Geomicrobium sp. JCM 19039]|uniref:hypothetical protein n=1 Tax=Geomicrobium sp. JCM 19039 TaxID=1460636 RepID=UPI00045F1B27|nr:hypothetical protein [Geomicrobium sp. JCM 19039]GAK10646.1 thermostable carboxypeptidase 1 [Geomicrobium sp. JCM 19039]
MPPVTRSLEQEFEFVLQRFIANEHSLALLRWDSYMYGSTKGAQMRAHLMGTLAEDTYRHLTSESVKQVVEQLDPNDLPTGMLSSFTYIQKQARRLEKIPYEWYTKYEKHAAKAMQMWTEARKANDFSVFRPFFDRLVALQMDYADYAGFGDDRYGAILDLREDGLTSEQVDAWFQQLQEVVLPLLSHVKQSNKQPKTGFLFEEIEIEEQMDVAKSLFELTNFDFESGRIDSSIHPYFVSLSPEDVRVGISAPSAKEFKKMMKETLYSCGQSLFAQTSNHLLQAEVPASMQQAYGLLFSSFISKSKSFLLQCKEQLPDAIHRYSIDELHAGMNAVDFTIVKNDSSELMAPLHLQIGYELEKAIMNGEIATRDLPHVWADKAGDYLSLATPHDLGGILQEYHFATADFGSQAVELKSYLQAATLYQTVQKEGDTDSLSAKVDRLRQLIATPQKKTSTKDFSDWLSLTYTSIY